MKAPVAAPIAAVVVVATLFAAVPAARQQATFRARTDVVPVDVSVKDRQRPVTGLRAEDFQLVDNEITQQVTEVSYGKVPIDITVVLDLSRSVTGLLLQRLRTAIRQLMTDLGKDDRLKLVTFNTRVSRTIDFTNNLEAVDLALRQAVPGGGSSIWDAVGVSLVAASHPDRRQMIVVFTDASDITSALDEGMLLDVARRTNASVFSVVPTAVTAIRGGRVVSSGITTSREGLQTFRALATETGGAYIAVAAGNSTDLTATFRRALDDFRTTYVLHFTPTGVPREGFHELRVSVKGRSNLDIRARRGYFW
ncbi:MAG TPA: VWA domain-containing protein [Vicinamibacterales bacterium]|nr:VWA domain-containing protein [Vicinamibacterales bacterium]